MYKKIVVVILSLSLFVAGCGKISVVKPSNGCSYAPCNAQPTQFTIKIR